MVKKASVLIIVDSTANSNSQCLISPCQFTFLPIIREY